jgi:hypothetical protein
MSVYASPPKITSIASTGRLFATQRRADDNVKASDNNGGNKPGKATEFWQSRNQFHLPRPPPGYSYLPWQPPFPGAPRFYHQGEFDMTPSSQPSSGVTPEYSTYGLSLQANDFSEPGCGYS